MKTIITLLLLVVSAPMMAQTNIISLKSHAGDIAQIDKETDNFGEPPWKMGVDSVLFVKKGVIVECGFGFRRDTIQSDLYDGHLTDRIKDYYAPNCVFVGFKESKNENHKDKKDSKQNGVTWIVALISILFLLNIRKFKSHFKSLGVIALIGSISLFSSNLSAQTNVISLKSHAGEMANIHDEKDNFGNPPMSRYPEYFLRETRIKIIDTVEFYRNGKVIQHYTDGLGIQTADTIKDDNFTKELTPYLRNQYPQQTVFIGFKKQTMEAAKPFFNGMIRNGVTWIVALAFILLLVNYKKFNFHFTSLGVIALIGSISLFSNNLSAQTNIISLKSHAGDLAQIQDENDNFGGIYEPPLLNPVQTVKFIRNGVIVEYRESQFQSEYPITNNKNVTTQQIDTLRSPYYTKNLTPEFKRNYPSTTVFVGFNREHSDTAKPYFDSIHKNGISLLALFMLASIGIGTLLFRSTQKTKV